MRWLNRGICLPDKATDREKKQHRLRLSGLSAVSPLFSEVSLQAASKPWNSFAHREQRVRLRTDRLLWLPMLVSLDPGHPVRVRTASQLQRGLPSGLLARLACLLF